LIAQKVFGKSLLHVRLKTMINWIQNKRHKDSIQYYRGLKVIVVVIGGPDFWHPFFINKINILMK